MSKNEITLNTIIEFAKSLLNVFKHIIPKKAIVIFVVKMIKK